MNEVEQENKEQQKEEKEISKHEFFFELPLYSIIKKENLNEEFNLFFSGDVDAFVNGMDTTFSIKANGMYSSYNGSGFYEFSGYYAIKLTCKRKGTGLYFFVLKREKDIVKIGQFPSLADLQYAEIGKKYDKVLSKKDLHDLKKAIGLSAHGAGAGSLVYLRRIFENIIWETYEKNKSDLEFSEDDFKKKRMDEKVIALKDFLPEQLVEMRHAYAVLSKGIHELSESECLTYFPILKLSIELILDQKIEKEIKEKKDKSVKEQLKSIADKLK